MSLSLFRLIVLYENNRGPLCDAKEASDESRTLLEFPSGKFIGFCRVLFLVNRLDFHLMPKLYLA